MNLSNIIIVSVATGVLASLTPLLPARIAPLPIRVGPNVQVSASHRLNVHYEVIACAHPTDRNGLVVGSVIYSAQGVAFGTIVYRSSDGGVTWTPTLTGPEMENTGDPACAFAPDGSVYYTASLIPIVGDRTMQLYRSSNGGGVWDQHSSLTYTDREYVTVDPTTGPYAGRVYVNGNNRVPRTAADFVVFASSDRGRSFHGPGKRAAFGETQTPFMGNAVVVSDGTLIGVFGEARRAGAQTSLVAVTSRDGGETLTPAVTIAPVEIGGNRKGTDNNVNSEPILAIDGSRGRFRDRLYVVWPDRRSGHSQIFLASSADSGATWSAARAINDNLPPPADSTDQFMPAVAVNRNGVVGVLWYDRRNHPDNLGWDARFSAS